MEKTFCTSQCVKGMLLFQDLAKQGARVFYLPELSWTGNNALSCVTHTLLEATLVYMSLIFVPIQCFYPEHNFLFFWEAP